MLGGTLARDDTFWAYAAEISEASDPQLCADEIATRYVPRASPARETVARLLLIASENTAERFDRSRTRAGRGVLNVQTAAGFVAYFEGDTTRRANAYSDAGIRILDEGAVLVARRGAGECLECGKRLDETRRPTFRGDKVWTELVNYCGECMGGELGKRLDRQTRLTNLLPEHLEAMRMVLGEATDQLR